MTDIIDFESERELRSDTEILEDAARWENFRYDFTGLIVVSQMSESSVVSASLRALLEMLENTMTCDEAKAFIARRLKAFRDQSKE